MKSHRFLPYLAVLGLAILIAALPAITPGLAAAGLPRPLAGAPENWLHFGYDSAFSGYNPAETTLNASNVIELERHWGLGCGVGWEPISRSPAIYNNRLFTTGQVDNLKAYNLSNGQLLWEFGKDSSWAPQPVVSQDGIVFYLEEGASTIYSLYAVNSETGQQIWKSPIGFDLGYTESHLVTIDETNNLIYMLESPFMGGGKLYALNKQTGAIVWQKSKVTDNVEFKGDYALLDKGKLYVIAETPTTQYQADDRVLRIDAAAHTIDTTYDRPQPADYSDIAQISLCNNRVYSVFDDRYNTTKQLAAYNLDSPAIAWSKPVSATTGTIACNPALNRLYLPTDTYLYALDASTGEQVWKYTGYGKIYSPSIANGVLYFLSDTNLYAISEADGQRLFTYPLGKEAGETTQVAVANGSLYFSGNGGDCNLFSLWIPDRRIFLPMLNHKTSLP